MMRVRIFDETHINGAPLPVGGQSAGILALYDDKDQYTMASAYSASNPLPDVGNKSSLAPATAVGVELLSLTTPDGSPVASGYIVSGVAVLLAGATIITLKERGV